ncbi:hypothetical protein LTR84_009105 [Exophiala bonariae]|uniref:NmrA-like domain-containing protein n=1 Tax=Exophiala bonariae TaxID=1690606 RepID=A0AAV9MV47_9EURO|nr:hypothetical protein LTR84_009105 [Exophiala bonariae]
MLPSCPVVLVTSTTGFQGGGVVREFLIKAKSTVPPTLVHIHAYVRDPASAAAQALVSLDPNAIKLFQGDFDDVAALARAAQGTTATFINVKPIFTDTGGESRHAHNILNAALDTSIKYIIYLAVNHTD